MFAKVFALAKAHKVVSGLVALGLIGSVGAATPQDAQQNTQPAQQSNSQIESVDSAAEPAAKLEPVKKTVTETVPIDFGKTTVNDANLEKGKTAIRTAGVKGVKTLTYEVTVEGATEKDKKLVKEEVTTAPITEVTAVGTKLAASQNCDPNYSPCIPNVSYDLDCADVGFEVRIIGTDRHGLDGRDNDGYSCESY